MQSSFAPVVGYSPTYSFAFGAGWFFNGGVAAGRLVGIYALANAFQLQPQVTLKVTPWVEWDIDSTLQRGFEPYFGEGSRTRVADRHDIHAFRSETTTGIRFHPSESTSISPRIGLRTYHLANPGPPVAPRGRRLVSPTLGLNFRWDLRGREAQDKDLGLFHETELWWSPPGWSEATGESFLTAETRFTYGVPLVLGAKLVATINLGASAGNPDYAYRFKLGGSSRLRGYSDNRFRGKFFYLHGTELRVPLSGMFSVAGFGTFGEARDNLVRIQPRFSYGGGLRAALPPDRVQWARLDVGIGEDSWGFYADFGLPF